MNRPLALVAAVAATLLLARPVQADVISEYLGGAFGVFSNNNIPGQSFTTPAGGPWSQIRFNFFSDQAEPVPMAAGTLYLFTEEYTGSPAGLSAAAPGFLAASTGVVGGVYQFAPGVALLSDTTYYAYSDTGDQGILIDAFNGGHSFSDAPNVDFRGSEGMYLYRVTGTPFAAVTPEPATLGVLATLSAVAVVIRRRKAAGT